MADLNKIKWDFYYFNNDPDGGRERMSLNDEEREFFLQGGGIVSEADKKTLNQLTYEEETDRVVSSATLQTKNPSYYLLGDTFKLSNGVYAISFELGDGTNAIGLNTQYNSNGSIAPKYYHFDPREDLIVNNVQDQTITMPFELQYTTFGDNLTFDFRIIPAEAGQLRARYWLGTEKLEENLIFNEVKTFTEEEVGFETSFGVGNKYILPQGQALLVEFTGIELKGGIVSDTNSPFYGQELIYFISEIQPYKAVNLVDHTENVNEDIIVKYPAEFVVDTTNGDITITVPVGCTEAFKIFDGYQSFGSNSCYVDFTAFGQGVLELNNNRDSYKFFFDGTQWRYIDLDVRRTQIV